MAQFTSGLNGVNIGMDNASSQALYLSIGFVCIIITAVRLLQRGNGHLRQVVSLGGGPEQQAFWKRDHNTWWPTLKRHLFLAPLRHKRHNREIQLSRAVNVGTIPGRFHALLLSLYFISNIIYMTLLDYTGQPQAATLAELRGRSGHLATLNMIALFLMAGRNNPFISILRVSFDTFNLFHRWIGRVVVIEAVIHTTAWAMDKVAATGWSSVKESLDSSPFIQWGTVSLVAMMIIFIQAPSAVRHAFYETFLHLHRLLAFLALLGVFYHAQLGQLPQLAFIVFIGLIWASDWIMRFSHIIYRNYTLKRGFTRVVVEALPGEACRVIFHTARPWTPSPGSHVYAYLPSVSLWMSHPFSVAWTTSTADTHPDYNLDPHTHPLSTIDLEKDHHLTPSTQTPETTVSLVMSARTGMTRTLYERASRGRNGRITLLGALEGPYGSLESLHSYGTILLFAGGVGITHQLPHLRDLLASHANCTIPVKRITLVWAVRSSDMFEWIRPWMDEILSMPGRRDVLHIQLFVTKPKGPRDVASASERVQVFPGRPNARVIVEKEFRERVGAMFVGVCGPGALGDDVRDAARGVMQRGKVDFSEEAFSW
ncbi:hypothetical protein MMC10_006225 [Thelotrema lepadinum]|nr:hypothetical protein [Thelotrema lepadinum]